MNVKYITVSSAYMFSSPSQKAGSSTSVLLALKGYVVSLTELFDNQPLILQEEQILLCTEGVVYNRKGCHISRV